MRVMKLQRSERRKLKLRKSVSLMKALTQNHFDMFESLKFSFHGGIFFFLLSGNSNKSDLIFPLSRLFG